jgi:hypothetical protein
VVILIDAGGRRIASRDGTILAWPGPLDFFPVAIHIGAGMDTPRPRTALSGGVPRDRSGFLAGYFGQLSRIFFVSSRWVLSSLTMSSSRILSPMSPTASACSIRLR